jgi:hypothetical protein
MEIQHDGYSENARLLVDGTHTLTCPMGVTVSRRSNFLSGDEKVATVVPSGITVPSRLSKVKDAGMALIATPFIDVLSSVDWTPATWQELAAALQSQADALLIASPGLAGSAATFAPIHHALVEPPKATLTSRPCFTLCARAALMKSTAFPVTPRKRALSMKSVKDGVAMTRRTVATAIVTISSTSVNPFAFPAFGMRMPESPS